MQQFELYTKAINYQKGKTENTLIVLELIAKCFKALVVNVGATNNGSSCAEEKHACLRILD